MEVSYLLDEIKRTLSIKDDSHDEQLQDFINRITSRLLLRIGEDHIPLELNFIIVECVVKRFNLIGNEGMSEYSQEGETIKYIDLLNEYNDDITLWINSRDRKVNETLGVVRFI